MEYQLPAKDTELVAMGPVILYALPDKNAQTFGFSDRGTEDGTRGFQSGDFVGASEGESILDAADGTVYLKIRQSYWFQTGTGIFKTWRNEIRTAYIVLDQQGKTWKPKNGLLVGDRPRDDDQDYYERFIADVLPGWTGVPKPVSAGKKGEKWYITWGNGFSLDRETLDKMPNDARYALTTASADNVRTLYDRYLSTGSVKTERLSLIDDKETPGGDKKSSFNIWAIIAGVGVLGLLGIVLFLSLRRPNQRQQK